MEMKKLRKLPKFSSEGAERRFWATHDSSDYVDYLRAAKTTFPNLKPTSHAADFHPSPESLLLRTSKSLRITDLPYRR